MSSLFLYCFNFMVNVGPSSRIPGIVLFKVTGSPLLAPHFIITLTLGILKVNPSHYYHPS
jgi:hypothetical protein